MNVKIVSCWLVKLGEWANSIDFRFLHVCIRCAWGFVWDLLYDGRSEGGREWTASVFENERKVNFSKVYLNFLFGIETRGSRSTYIFIFFTVPRVLGEVFACSGRKHVEAGPNFSYELATFLKYRMPLSDSSFIMYTSFTRYEKTRSGYERVKNCIKLVPGLLTITTTWM